jgi:hypothetical protein
MRYDGMAVTGAVTIFSPLKIKKKRSFQQRFTGESFCSSGFFRYLAGGKTGELLYFESCSW